MADDPYAQYLTPPSAASGGDDPYAKYLAPPGAPLGAATSDNDYSKSPLSAVARTFESSADWGTGDLLRAAATGKKPSETAAQSSAAAASLPWYIRYPTEAAGYGAGLVNLLDPVTDAAEAGALGLGAGAKLAKLAGTAAEGATVGAVSHVAGSDDPGLTDTAGAALGGGLVGTAAGAAAPLINKGLTKVLSKPGTVDPAVAIASTAKDSADAYAALHQKPVDPIVVAKPISTAMPKPNSSEDTGMSPTFRNQVGDIQTALGNHYYQGTQPSLGDVNSWKRQINEATVTSVDGKIAGRMNAGLDGVMETTAPGLNDAAQTAYQQSVGAQNLAEWQRKIANGVPLGQAPVTEAEKWYQGKPQYQDLVDLYKANQGGVDPSYTAAHLGSEIGGTAGYAVGGFPGHLIGKSAGYYLGKTAGKKWKGSLKGSGQTNAIQALYPGMTGIQPTGATAAPQISDQVGEQIKNLMLGVGVS